MSITITSLNPAAGAQGTLVAIQGTGIDTSCQVRFTGLERQMTVAPSFVSDTEIRAYAPSFDGLGGTLAISVVNGIDASNELAFALAAYPAVEAIYPLCSLGKFKQIFGLQVGETMDDVKLLAMIEGASMAITAEARQDFRPTVIVGELRDGDDSALLKLAHTPIVSVQALAIGGQAIDPTEAKVYPGYIRFEESGDYAPRTRSVGRLFPQGNQNIRVDYTAGFSAVPGDLSMACMMQVVFILNTLGKQGVISEQNPVANANTTYALVPISPAARSTVNRYRRTRMAVV